ncbi:MAG: D-alanine--D-alanine ligase [Candidatus Paceibacterota bacterium]|jgi:D-alanine-D-alanine ligase
MLRVGVIRGGIGHEYEVSLKTGSSVLKHLDKNKYQTRDILIDKTGQWHFDGVPLDPTLLPDIIDVALIALHGEYGEDGQVQNLLDRLKVPYTGSGHVASSLGMNKVLSKELVVKAGIKTPLGIEIKEGDDYHESAKKTFSKISPPWVVKPVDRGSSVGLYLAKNIDELIEAIDKSFEFTDKVLIEEYIKGREGTCGVVEDLRGQEIYPLFPIEIIPPKGEKIWGYADKYSGETTEVCPANFTDEQKKNIQEMAVTVHQVLGLCHYSQTDFIISPRGIYFLETNTLPGLTDTSLLPKALAAAGIKYPDFLDHLIKLALKRH